MILVCFAMENEARPFRMRARQRPDLALLVHGVGIRNAENTFRRWLDSHPRPELVFSCGFAGGLDPRWGVGDVLYDANKLFPWIDRLQAAGAHPAQFHQATQILVTAAEKKACREATGCDAVEMESQILRGICAVQNIPSATVRVISDIAIEDMPLDFNRFMTPQQTLSYGRVLACLATHPGILPGLLRLNRQTHFAAKQLAATLAQVLGIGLT
jgi:adenosylhomocysteine nucleosidase